MIQAGQEPTPAVFDRLLVGSALGRTLAGPAGALRQVEDGASPLQSLVPCRLWERVFDALTLDPDNKYLMIDSTIVRAHQLARRARTKGYDDVYTKSNPVL